MLLRGKDRRICDALSSIRYPPDRGLDHAVGRERHLRPIFNLKNVIVSEPSKSAPFSLLSDLKEKLGIPFRPVEFVRKYPSVFQEFYLSTPNIHPYVKLTPQALSLNSEETLLYNSVCYKDEIASRLLKLLMISRIRRIPIDLVERLRWELGLPHDFTKSIIPEFPDFFRVISGNLSNEKILELVCWSDELAVSDIEKNGSNFGNMSNTLVLNGFEVKKKYKKWLDDWHKLPYVSPYENAMHLASKSDECDKWAVAVLHEILSLFVGKKADRESLFSLGEFWGLRSRFKRAILQHPGIFYVSKKIGMRTVILREAYKRGMLIERHPLMDLRIKYAKLMNAAMEKGKVSSKQKKETDAVDAQSQELDDGEVTEEDDDKDETYDSSSDENDLEATTVRNGRRLRRKAAFLGDRSAENRYTRRASRT